MQNESLQNLLDIVQRELILPIVKEASDQMVPTPMKSVAQESQILLIKQTETFKIYLDKLQNGIKILNEHGFLLTDPRMEEAKIILSNEEKLAEYLNQGKTLQDIFDLSKEELLEFYDVASELNTIEKFDDAASVFMLLIQFNPTASPFWSGLGIVQEKMGDYSVAVECYVMAAEFDTLSLDNYLYAAKCLVLLQKATDAMQLLTHALERADLEENLKDFIEPVKTMMEEIKLTM